MFKMRNCEFCKREEENIISETDNIPNILRNLYLIKRHTGVMLKEHHENFLELMKKTYSI